MKIINYFNYNSIVILTMFFISLVEVILHYVLHGVIIDKLFSTERASLLNPLTYLRSFTHIFGHSDWGHFSRNYMKILLLGPMIEEKYGSVNLLIMVLITAFAISTVNAIVGKSRLRGASGIVFMLVGLSSIVNISDGRIPLTLVLIIIFYIMDEIIDTIINANDGVSHLSHLVGAICGIVFGFICININLTDSVLNLLLWIY